MPASRLAKITPSIAAMSGPPKAASSSSGSPPSAKASIKAAPAKFGSRPQRGDHENIDAGFDRHHAVGGGAARLNLVHCRGGAEIAGRPVERQIVEAQIGVGLRNQLVKRAMAGNHVLNQFRHILGRSARQSRRDAVRRGIEHDSRMRERGRPDEARRRQGRGDGADFVKGSGGRFHETLSERRRYWNDFVITRSQHESNAAK